MDIRKMFAALLALVVTMSLSLSVFAASGYSSGGSGGSGGSRTSGGFVSGNGSQASKAATAASVKKTAEKAIKAAVNGKAIVRLYHVKTLPAAAIQDIFKQAKAAGVAVEAYIDVVDNGVTISRIYIEEATAKALTGTVDFTVGIKTADVASAVKRFEKVYSNNAVVVSFSQNAVYGVAVKMAVKVDLSKLNTDNLKFYSYDKSTDTYTEQASEYRIDSKGYLHFTTQVGGDIFITDKELVRK